MSTITSAHLSIASGPAPGAVFVGVHGTFDVAAAASLQRVCDGILDDRDVLTIGIDLHDVHGVDVTGISGLASAAAWAAERGAELTLHDPPELLCQALQMEGLTDLIRIGHLDRRPSPCGDELVRRQSRRRHPSGALLPVDRPKLT